MGHEKWQALRAYALNSHAVEGWLHPVSVVGVWSLLEAQMAAGIVGDVAEIGVYYGKLFILMALGLDEGEKAWAVDPFFMKKVDFEQAFRENLKKYDVDKFSIVNRKKSQDIARGDAHQNFGSNVRMFSVDGWHDRSCVRHDLHLATESTIREGVILVDDFCSVWTPDVTIGVVDFLNESDAGFVPVAVISHEKPLSWGGYKLILSRPDYAALYVGALRKGIGQVRERPCEFMGKAIPLFEAQNSATKEKIF